MACAGKRRLGEKQCILISPSSVTLLCLFVRRLFVVRTTDRNVMIIRKQRSNDDVTLLRATTAVSVNQWTKEINNLLESVRKLSLRSRTAIAKSTPASGLYQPNAASRGQSVASVVFPFAFSLGLCFVCSFVLFDLSVCPHSFMFP